jgi:hypothetical protein
MLRNPTRQDRTASTIECHPLPDDARTPTGSRQYRICPGALRCTFRALNQQDAGLYGLNEATTGEVAANDSIPRSETCSLPCARTSSSPQKAYRFRRLSARLRDRKLTRRETCTYVRLIARGRAECREPAERAGRFTSGERCRESLLIIRSTFDSSPRACAS